MVRESRLGDDEGVTERDLCCDGTVLCLHCSVDYMNLHM